MTRANAYEKSALRLMVAADKADRLCADAFMGLSEYVAPRCRDRAAFARRRAAELRAMNDETPRTDRGGRE